MPSKFVEILEPEDISHLRRSASDVRLEDVLADHEAISRRGISALEATEQHARGDKTIAEQPSF
ncbi:hypothetical protein BDW42DRAFT_189837 [Aspergillus taichungensis]|uniref:Uncharacterized protein n=1 Tax=Aspergillus taichungensis TaxID=482145 RepID=A0A2J5IAB8_9EURO|nr:hypothetical protein BDW42DRAFT_189837 [Aspergillus taichungensis]